MTSKRNLRKEVDDLREETSDDGVGCYVFGTKHHFETRSDSSRPELTVPDGVRGGYKTALPQYVFPEEYTAPVLFVSPAVVDTWPGESSDSSTPAPELWDSLREEQLREEYRLRRENGDAIPPVLEQYAPEE